MKPGDASTFNRLLAVRNLEVSVAGSVQPLLMVRELDVGTGEVIGIVGDPGAGKTIMARAIMQLLPTNLSIQAGSVLLLGEDLVRATEDRLDQLRGQVVSMMFQSPDQALDPLRTCMSQLAESFHFSNPGKAELAARFMEALSKLGFADPARILRSRPSQLSGGERQRILLAITTARSPALLIADEPTSGFDPALRAEFIRAIRKRAEAGLSTLLISHDRKLVEEVSDRIIRMKAGRLIGSGSVPHPVLMRFPCRETGAPLLEVKDLRIRRCARDVVRGLSFTVACGQALGLVGPSGSGKTSLARVLAGLLPASSGSVVLHARRPPRHPQPVQLVFQDPSSSLNPVMTVRDAITEPMRLRRLASDQVEDQFADLMARVGLDDTLAERRPGELSGGQRQLAAIARALAAAPALLVLDEPTASLDAATAAAVIGRVAGLLDEGQMGVILISHDLELVHSLCDTVVALDPATSSARLAADP